jgi:hypothetical protein
MSTTKVTDVALCQRGDLGDECPPALGTILFGSKGLGSTSASGVTDIRALGMSLPSIRCRRSTDASDQVFARRRIEIRFIAGGFDPRKRSASYPLVGV